MSKKKRNVIIVVTALLFFGALMFNLKYPLMSETSAETGKIAQENTVNDSKIDGRTNVNKASENSDSKADVKTSETVSKQEKEEQNKKETVENKNSSEKETKSKRVPIANNTNKQEKKSESAPKPKPKPAPKPEPKPEPKPTPKPEPKPQPKSTPVFKIPSTNHFHSAEVSSDPNYAEVYISMNIWENYDTQLNELYNVIAPVAGSSIANQIVSYARTKTEADIELNRSWYVGNRELEIGSTWGSGIVCFASWR